MDSMIATNIRRIISENGYKHSAIAIKAGYNPKTFSNMLNGRKLITDVDIAKIANVLGVMPGELFEATGQAG